MRFRYPDRRGGAPSCCPAAHDRYERTPDGWKFTERVYEIRYLDKTPLAGMAPDLAESAR
jgi:hypothetical protein